MNTKTNDLKEIIKNGLSILIKQKNCLLILWL